MSFALVRMFRDQESETTFKGTLDGRKLTGERVTSRGSQTVTGKKRNRTSAKQKTNRVKKASRKPDVIYVPTP
ncbi:MAG: hypothetical protein ACYSUX_07115, partial [Planctomycetota bacterium]